MPTRKRAAVKGRRTRKAPPARTRRPRRSGALALRALRAAGTRAMAPPEPEFTLIDVPGGANTSPEFREKVVQIAGRLRTNPNFLMAVISFESGGTFSPSVPNKAGSGAVGLIQFMPATARGLGTTTAALAAMTAEAQLDFVERHFRPFAGRLNTIEDTYMAVLLPKAVGKGPDFVLFQKPSVAFTQNRGLDIDGDGRVTVFDACSKVRQLLTAGGGGTGRILRRGSTGPEVETLQDELIGFGHLRPVEKAGGPGSFGARTERALKEFQSANGLVASGALDAPTHEVIRQINRGIGVGSRGGVVAGLHRRLLQLGNLTNAQLAASPDTFDRRTKEALEQFQRQHGIEPNGMLNVESYRALLVAAPVPTDVSARGDAVDTVLPVEGRGFATYNREPGGADQFGRASTITSIQSLGAAWAETHGFPFFVGDISRKGGGSFPPHSSHEDGRDVDFRPFRHGGESGATNINDPSYDHASTRELVVLIRRLFPSVKILFNDRMLVADKLTRPFAGHDNHLHVRFA